MNWYKITRKQFKILYDEDVDCGYNWGGAEHPIDDEHYPDYFYPTTTINNTNLFFWWEATSPRNRKVTPTKKLFSALDDILDRLKEEISEDIGALGKYNSIRALRNKINNPPKEIKPEPPMKVFNDTYLGRRWTYGLELRPLHSSHVPAGWILHSDFIHPEFKFGTVQYSRPLTPDEVKSYQLTHVPDREAV